MDIELINDKDVWDTFIDVSPYGLLFHKWECLKIVETHTGYRLLPYGIYIGNELTCVFPLFFRSSNGVKLIFSPPPRTSIPYFGFVFKSDYNAIKARKRERYLDLITSAMNGELTKLAPNYVAFSTVPNFLDVRNFIWDGYAVTLKYTYVIDLTRSLDDIWSSFGRSCRREIRQMDHFTTSIEQMDNVASFYHILQDRYRQQGLHVPIVSVAYLEDLVTTFSQSIKIYSLRIDSDMVGAIASCEYKEKAILWLGWVNLQRDVPSNEYLIWELIKKAKSEGFKEFDLAGAGKKHLNLFKSKFNPSLQLSFYVNKKDTRGKLAEFAYLHVLKKRWY